MSKMTYHFDEIVTIGHGRNLFEETSWDLVRKAFKNSLSAPVQTQTSSLFHDIKLKALLGQLKPRPIKKLVEDECRFVSNVLKEAGLETKLSYTVPKLKATFKVTVNKVDGIPINKCRRNEKGVIIYPKPKPYWVYHSLSQYQDSNGKLIVSKIPTTSIVNKGE